MFSKTVSLMPWNCQNYKAFLLTQALSLQPIKITQENHLYHVFQFICSRALRSFIKQNPAREKFLVSVKMSSKKSKRLGHLGAGVEQAPDPIFAPDGSVSPAALVELGALVSQRYVDAKPCPGQPELVLYNYTPRQQAYGSWTSVAKACRGLVLRHGVASLSGAALAGAGDAEASRATATVAARPLAKFFNVGEHAASLAAGETFHVLDKVDGSLGVVFHVNGAWRVNTRGSWVSPQAGVASEMLASLRVGALDPAFTYCVEILYPENRVVVNYGGRRELTLLAATEAATGRELSWEDLAALAASVGCPVVRNFGTGVCAEDEPTRLVARVMREWGAEIARGDEAEGFVLVGARYVGRLP